MSDNAIPFYMRNLAMTGDWVPYTIPNEVNTLMIQLRENADLKISTSPTGGPRLTLKSGRGLVLGSYNTNNQVLYFKGAAGHTVEIVDTRLP